MKFLELVMLTLVSVALVAGCAENKAAMEKAGARPMTGAELQARLAVERKLSWTNPKGDSGTAVYKPDGTASVDWGSGGDTGIWRIVDDTHCIKWKTVRNGKETCFTAYQADGKFKYFLPDGSLGSISKDM